MKKNNKKGFTLAELLIVVAIIAVLTAIAIPVFNSQLEKAKQSTDLANLRAAYAEAVTEAIENGTGSVVSEPMKGKGFDKLTSPKVGEISVSSYTHAVGATYTVSVNADGAVSLTAGAVQST